MSLERQSCVSFELPLAGAFFMAELPAKLRTFRRSCRRNLS